MSISPDYLRYRHRHRGLDHDWFGFRLLAKEPPVAWPSGKRLALWVTVHLEHFPIDMSGKPFPAIGGMRYVPDYHAYTNRDYGNRIGVYRVMRLLDSFGIKASAVTDADVALRYPSLIGEVVRRGWEVMAGGVDRGRLLHSGLSRDAENALIAESLTTLRKAAPVRGWHSPAHSESMNTLELLAAHGLDYVADWINDDMPYEMTTPQGKLHSLPLSSEWADDKVMVLHDRTIEEWEEQILNAFRLFEAESAREGGRILSLPLHAWVIGQPHRIQGLQRVLATIMASDAVWPATGAEILDAYKARAAT